MNWKLARLLHSILLFCGLTLCAASSAFAYSYALSCGSTGAKWGPQHQPLSYQINEAGTPDIPNASQLEKILDDSFTVWGEPCCSSFSARYEGRTSLTAMDEEAVAVLSFATEHWPGYLGHQTMVIGVALLHASSDCDMISAPIHFNNVGFKFSADGRWGTVRLQDIATHEVGHLLGLGHSGRLHATMYHEHFSGRAGHEIHTDDRDGVCSLYPVECECSAQADCEETERCEDGACIERRECERHSQCGANRMCDAGTCAPDVCQSTIDCPAPLMCQRGRCKDTCTTCRECRNSADCGGTAPCMEMADGVSRCLPDCDLAGECPGDSVCHGIQYEGATHSVCFNPDVAAQGLCPDGYVCTHSDAPKPQSCSGLGNSCGNNNPHCGSSNHVCFTNQNSTYCTCQCSSAAECGPGASCTHGVCIPAQAGSCREADCEAHERCLDGVCTAFAPIGAYIPPPPTDPNNNNNNSGGPGSNGDNGKDDTAARVEPGGCNVVTSQSPFVVLFAAFGLLLLSLTTRRRGQRH